MARSSNRIKKQNIACSSCGHFTVQRHDTGWMTGCSVFELIMKDEEFSDPLSRMQLLRELGMERDVITGLMKDVGDRLFLPIDTRFTLNKNGDCELWTAQTEHQKSALAKIRQLRRWKWVWHVKKFWRGIWDREQSN